MNSSKPRDRDEFLGWVHTAKGEVMLERDLTWYSPVPGLAEQAEKSAPREQVRPEDGHRAAAMLRNLVAATSGRAIYNFPVSGESAISSIDASWESS